ncbi:MAG: DUF1549 and DUF1553 domain-containing protein [Planctomycetota bacterium]
MTLRNTSFIHKRIRSVSFTVISVISALPAIWLIAAETNDPVSKPTEGRASDEKRIGKAWEDSDNPIHILFSGERLDLWSLQPISNPTHPERLSFEGERDASHRWDDDSHPIDRFLIADWLRDGKRPAPSLDRARWLQRAFLDLTGEKPSLDDIQAFENDRSPDAYERRIDALLASPSYGEHWARMWLDVIRYSDSNGFDWDEFRKEAWRYRNFVARAWNRDMPFDEFLTLQLAGDELVEGSPQNEWEQDALIATGYLRMGPYDNAAKLFNEQDRARAEVLADLTETTAAAMLGITMSCCRCHDHKTDPLSQRDHYRFRAFFASTQITDDRPINLPAEWKAIERHNSELDRAIESQQAIIDRWFERARDLWKQRHIAKAPQADPSDSSLHASSSAESDATQIETIPEEDLLAILSENKQQVLDAKEEIASLKSRRRRPTLAILMTDSPDAPDPIHVLSQGDHRQPMEQVEPGFPSVLDPNPPQWETPICKTSSGRRLTLAKWIVAPNNPWTARVIANRVWQQLFGEGLVATASDFGVTGDPPTHPALLDHLATTLIESGWSVKALQRHIVTSEAYRMSPVPKTNASLLESGRSSVIEHPQVSTRSTLRRLSAEQLRDCVLQVTGRLQHRVVGAPIWPELSADILQANPAVLDDNETKTKGWYPSPASDQTVRSLYLIQKRTLRLPWMETFDLPENTVSCPKREISIVAPQALSLLNAPWVAESATEFADQVLVHTGENKTAITVTLFQELLQRSPSAVELKACTQFLQTRRPRDLALVLLNSNEFAFIP